MKLHQLRYFVAVAEAGSIRQAARTLNLSQSAVTQAIKELESSLGTELLERRSHSVLPTAAGSALIKRIGVIEAELRYAEDEIRMIDGSMVGDISIGMSPAVAFQILPDAIMKLKTSRPGVRMRFGQALYPDFLEDVRAGRFDFFVGIIPDDPRNLDRLDTKGLEVDLIASERLQPVVRAEHPLASQKNLTLDELAKWEWISFGRREDQRHFFERRIVAEGLPLPPSTIETDSNNLVRALLERSDYIAFLPRQFLTANPEDTDLVELSINGPVPSWEFAIIKRENNLLPPVTRMLISEIERAAKRELKAA